MNFSKRKSSRELSYVKTLNKIEQCNYFHKKSLYNIKKTQIKIIFLFVSFIFFLLTGIYLSNLNIYLLIPFLIINLFILFFIKRYKNNKDKYRIENSIFLSIKQIEIEKLF